MFRFGSSLASRVSFINCRLINTTSTQPVCCTWSRNYGAEDTKRFIGTKYESVLVKALNDEALNALGRANLTDLTQGFRMAADAVVRNLNRQARKITTFEEIAQVGTTAANGDREIGDLIAKAFEKGWENDLITIFDRKALYNELKFVKGMKLEWGLKSPYFVNYKNKNECVLDNALVLIYDTKISNSNVIRQASLPCIMQKHSLLIVAEDVENEVLGDIVTDFTCTTEKVCVIKAAGLAEDRKAIMEDLAILTGGQVLTGGLGMNSTYFVPLKLGSCRRVIATMDNVVIIGGSGELVDIQERCEQLRSTIKLSTSDKLKDRLAKLSGGSVVDKLLEHDSSDLGYDPARGNYIDMFQCGYVDPLKHVRSEFAKAASMISLKNTM